MAEDRKEISLADVADAQRKGLNHVLDNLEVSGTVVVRDSDGNIKGEFELTKIEEDK